MKPEQAIAFFRQCAIDIANSSSPAQKMALLDYGQKAEATIRQALPQEGRDTDPHELAGHESDQPVD